MWVVRVEQGRGRTRYGQGYSPDRRIWTRAGWLVARRHLASVGGGDYQREQDRLARNAEAERTGRGVVNLVDARLNPVRTSTLTAEQLAADAFDD